jgi:glycine/D-amino acid oxidase-like deaminating enzyme
MSKTSVSAGTATTRRGFFTGLTTMAGALSSNAAAADNRSASLDFQQPEQRLPLCTDSDVIVCGAGPAGVSAAITAARAGAKVSLFEAHGSLGGVWTSSLLGYLLDFDKPGFNQELVRRLRDRDAIEGGGMNGLSYHPEEMKLLLEELCSAAGVKVQLHTRVCAAHREGGSLRTIVTESKSGRQAWRSTVFIDATGDGDLGAQAGCDFEIGRQKECPCQPMTMYALIVVKDAAAIADCIHPTGNDGRHVGPKAFRDTLARAGVTPSYGNACLFPIKENLVLLMANHEYGVNATDAAQVSDATLRARSEVHRIVRGLRKLGGPWDGVQIVATPEQIGIRDGRRIRGRYVVSKEDLVAGVRQEDAVVRASFPVDIHALSAEDNRKAGYGNGGVKMKPYDIPLRALIARDVDGLMMAGRCISGDFIAHASYRVTGNAVAMGEAAGAVAAIAAQTKRRPHEVEWSEARPVLERTRA